MKKICPICKNNFEDDSWDQRKDYCPKCQEEWNKEQDKNLSHKEENQNENM